MPGLARSSLSNGHRLLHAKLPNRLLAALAVSIVCVAPALAGKYELIKGQGVEVCEAYKKNLNSFKPKVPMTCARAVSPEMPEFAKPRWEQQSDGLAPNGASIAESYWAMTDLLWQRDVNPVVHFSTDQWSQWRASTEQLKEARESYRDQRSTLYGLRPPYIAEFDIDNDGSPEPMYLEQPCGTVYGARLAVLTSDWKTIDLKKTALVMPHPSFKEMGYGVFRPVKKGDWGIPPNDVKIGRTPTEDAWHDLYYDVFFYKGRTYFDQWWRNHPDFEGKSDMDVGHLRVYETSPKGTTEICTYRFDYLTPDPGP